MIGSSIVRSIASQVNTVKAAVLAVLAASNGAGLVGYVQSGAGAIVRNVLDRLRESFSVHDFMSAAEIADANNPAGPTAGMHSAAFAACFAAAEAAGVRRVWVPPVKGAYSVGDVDIPEGITLAGCRRPVYNPATVAAVYGMGSVIVKDAGAANLFRWRGYSGASGIIFHGNGKTAACFETVAGRLSQMHIDNCGMHGFLYGVGNTAYMSSTRLRFCSISQNAKGVFALIDSQVSGNFINANDQQGIDLPNGANDVLILGNKIEWNTQEGVRLATAANCEIDGNIIDRNGRAGVRVGGGCRVNIGANVMRRNGRAILGNEECAHVYFAGASTLSLGAILSRSGADDDGAGDTTPNYTLSIGAATPDALSWQGGDATGCVTSAVRYGSTPTVCKVRGVAGVEDLVNSGYFRVDNGRHFFARSTLANLAPGATSAALTVSHPALATFTRRTFKVRIEARDATTGGSIVGEAFCLLRRDGGATTAHFVQAPMQALVSAGGGVAVAATYIGATALETLQLAFANVAADGSTFDVTVKNNDAADTYAPTVTVAQ